MLVSEAASDKVQAYSNKAIVIASFAVVGTLWAFLNFGLKYFFDEHPSIEGQSLNFIRMASVILYMYGAFRLHVKITIASSYVTKDNYKWCVPLVFFACLLPGNAFKTGKDTALRIVQNTEFTYVIAESLVTPKKNFYKYLGKAGDVHILLTLDNSRHIILPVDKLSPFIAEKYSLLDLPSMNRFRKHIIQLRANSK
ncbi:hypothetical protein GCM10022409_45130 [Hymenobacter glaciei]|uniref:DUF5673 domain-containing protein n=2 Tax=Hymenobacter glaciei TaxID=877209 RepID=A0ABP7UUI0_9BACT